MAARFERSSNENEQVVWLSDTDPSIGQAPAHDSNDYVNPLSRLFRRSIEGVSA
jgi:hypothetical protein